MKLGDYYTKACQTSSDINALLPVLHAYAMQCRRITEFGVRYGASTAALLSALPIKYIGYDIQTDPMHSRLLDAAKAEGVNAEIRYEDTTKLETIDHTDLLFIDTLHTYEQVYAELLHAPKVEKFIIFHDTVTFGKAGEVPGSRGIQAAIDDRLKASPNWGLQEERFESNGLQIWTRTR